MGWLNYDIFPDGRHEGYFVGLLPAMNADNSKSDWRFRELSSAAGDDPGATDWPLRSVQVGCECGWRSPRLEAPVGTVWVPFSVFAPEWFEDEARVYWREHVKLEAERNRTTRV